MSEGAIAPTAIEEAMALGAKVPAPISLATMPLSRMLNSALVTASAEILRELMPGANSRSATVPLAFAAESTTPGAKVG